MHSSGQSLGPGGRRLKAVDSGANLFDEEDEEGNGKKRRERGLGEEGDLDEQVYEEDFADDEEKIEMDDNDEEAKELEVCILFTTLTIFSNSSSSLGAAEKAI